MEKKVGILVVDDEKSIRLILGEYFESLGFDVFVAEDGEEGVKSANENNPDFIFTDVDMPKMGGLEMIQQIWKKGKKPKIFIMSGRSTDELEKFISDHQEIIFLEKPFRLSKVELLLKDL